MFGRIISQAPQILFIVLLAAFLERIMGHMLPVMSNGAATENDPLFAGIEAVAGTPENFALVGIIALVVAFLARSVVEGNIGG